MVNLSIRTKRVIFGFLISLFLLIVGVSIAFAQVSEPTDFSVTPASSCAFTLEWTGDESNYNVERKTLEGASYGVETDVSFSTDDETEPPTHSFVDSHDSSLWGGSSDDPIDPGTGFEYRVQGYDPVTEDTSTWNQPRSATTLSLPDKPSSPVSLEGIVSDDGNIEVRWATSTPMSSIFYDYGGFDIYVSTSNNGGQNYSSPTLLSSEDGWGGWTVDGKHFYDTSGNDKNLTYQYSIYTREVGGLGCDFYRDEHHVLSDSSETLTIPVRPSNFSGEAFDSPDRQITLTWDDDQHDPDEDVFEIERSLSESFTGSVARYTASTDSELYEDESVKQTGTETYYYRIRSCIGDDCSFWSPTVEVTVGLPVPEDLTANIMYATTTHADIQLNWLESAILPNSDLILERATSSREFIEIYSQGTPRNNEGSYFDTDVELGEEYYYRAKIETSDGESAYSPEATANLKLAYILHGVGWSASENPGSIGVAGSSGSGWFKLNSDADNGVGADSEEYSVVINKGESDDGKVTGAAWTDNFGWLSFYESDLVDCPSGTCSARINLDTGELSGWARFTAAPEAEEEGDNPFSWNGWVSLSGSSPSYGVSLDLSSASDGVVPIEGQAWGGPMVGWMDFGSTQCEQDTCTARALNLGEPPLVEAGNPHDILVNNEHTHAGAYASDPEGDMESYVWELIDCEDLEGNNFTCPSITDEGSGNVTGGEGEIVEISGPVYTPERAGFYTAELTVEDYFGNEGSDIVVEEAINIPPQIYAGDPHMLAAEQTHAHDDDHEDGGPFAEDENGDLESYEWSWVECFDYENNPIEPCPELSNTSGTFSESIGPGQRVTVEGPEYTPPIGGRTFRLLLTVEDSFGNVETDDVTEVVPECSDGIDNEGDGLVDLDDPDCQNGNDDGESAEGFDEFDFFFEEQ